MIIIDGQSSNALQQLQQALAASRDDEHNGGNGAIQMQAQRPDTPTIFFQGSEVSRPL